MRHDVDFSLDKAVQMAELENRIGICSTYFVLLSTNFYNVLASDSYDKVKEIMAFGHEVGLHFDEQKYEVKTPEDVQKRIMEEVYILSNILKYDVRVISMHRPSKKVLESDLQLNGVINSYSSDFFVRMKYLSDSRMHWRENVVDIIRSNKFDRLHILTHPFWYSSIEESMEGKLRAFLNEAIIERYDNMNANFRNLREIISREGLGSHHTHSSHVDQ
jgi:hypothetical protein